MDHSCGSSSRATASAACTTDAPSASVLRVRDNRARVVDRLPLTQVAMLCRAGQSRGRGAGPVRGARRLLAIECLPEQRQSGGGLGTDPLAQLPQMTATGMETDVEEPRLRTAPRANTRSDRRPGPDSCRPRAPGQPGHGRHGRELALQQGDKPSVGLAQWRLGLEEFVNRSPG